MFRRVLVAITLLVAGVCLPAAAVAADETASSVEVPQSVGIMGAVAPPSESGDSPAAPIAEAVGVVFLLGGSVTALRSWVSTKQTV